MPKVPLICCDICHVDLIHTMINDCDNNHQAVPHGSNCPKRPEHTLTWRGSQFQDALYHWHTKTATGMFGMLDFWPADLFLHKDILENIVIFANANKIITLQDLQRMTNWFLCNWYSDQIISILHHFFPPAPPPSPFVSMPLPPRTYKRGPNPFLNVLNASPGPLSLSSSSTGICKP